MTMNEAAALRVKWKEHAHLSPCEHLNLELEWNNVGPPTGTYICIICGEPVAQESTSS